MEQPNCTKAVQFLTELLMDHPFSGDKDHRELCMMMLNGQQGSTGLEEALCEILNITKIADKHGFDAVDENGIHYELKPTKDVKKLSVTYNDITDKKLDSMRSCENVFVLATVEDGKLTFLMMVDGKLIVTLLQESYYKVEIVNKKRIECGEAPRRASLSVSMNNIVNTFTRDSINVVYFKANSGVAKKIGKYLGLTADINKLPGKYGISRLTELIPPDIVVE